MNDLRKILELVHNSQKSAFFYTPVIYKNAVSYIYKRPVEEIIVTRPGEIFNAFERIEDFRSKGLKGYGLVAYEAGYIFENKLKSKLAEEYEKPLIQFYFFDKENFEQIESSQLNFYNCADLLEENNYSIEGFNLNTTKDEYIKNINKVKNYISDGDTYQVNYTVKGKFNIKGDINSLFMNLIFNQSASYSAFINTGTDFILSISPELFFKTGKNVIISQPMKGTIRRGINLKNDRLSKNTLLNSEKDKAENVMIVDLIRNDIGRISEFNSVEVSKLFEIVKLESVYQMVSDVTGQMRGDKIGDIFKNIFPCGSITGAPKIRTMEIISELEKEERNIYTGAIGMIHDESAVFNVPIRTICIDKNSLEGEIGIGSGVVWDSDPESEYNETILKAKFLTQPNKYFELIETILIENKKIFLWDYHINRLKESAGYFLFNFDENKIMNLLTQLIGKLDSSKKYLVRILLSKWGEITITHKSIESVSGRIQVTIAEKKVNSENKFQYFKTTNRKIYDDQIEQMNGEYFESLFLNEKNEVAEGAFTNVFIVKDGKRITPPVESGLLNGCYRQFLLDNNKNILVDNITLVDLLEAEQLILVNSVRKEILADELYFENKLIKSFH